ncbi:porin [Paracoccus sp. ME4]|uniref:porin n=1 Tax=Paracoccus sp. ME4 TaxID=3138066 RepID=UPI00398ABD72
MKKALIASTALVLSAGVAAADVTISGYGRTAVVYQEDRSTGNDAQISSRVRMNVHATTSTDQGVDFGARLRLQWDQGDESLDRVSPGQVYVTASGFTVAVGNVGTAYDNAGLIYESEVGLISQSFGNSNGDFFAYESKGYAKSEFGIDYENRLGISVEYAVDALTARFSYIDTDQTGTADFPNSEDELGLSIDYDWNDFQISVAGVQSGLGFDGNDQWFVGAYYTLPGTENGIGMSYLDNGNSYGVDDDGLLTVANEGKTFVLYGDYVVAPLTTLSAYIANNDAAGNETDNAFGLGAKYDLGGAYLAGSLERGYNEKVRGDFGVRFDF